MKIIAITMVKNEMDVIESFVRHTLSFADELIVCDHQSSDATREILEKLRIEGLPIEIQTEYRAAHVQEEVMSRLLLVAANRGADLIVPLDADEFLLPRERGSARAVLESLSTDDVYRVQWRLLAPVGGDEKTFLLQRPLCSQRGFDQGRKCIVGGALARRLRPQITEGNHTIFVSDAAGRHTIPDEPCELYLAHFFWRSTEQWRSKALVTWVNIAAQFSVDAYPAGGYLNYALQVLAGKGKTLHDVIPDAVPCNLMGYAEPQTLRYSGEAQIDVLRNLAAASTVLAESYAVLRAAQQKSVVTSVVPYLGDEAAFRTSLASVRAEVFPRHQILVPVLAGALSAELARELDGLVREGGLIVISECRDVHSGGDTYEALAARATGAFVEWVLPGETVAQDKLRAMVTSFLLNPVPFACLISTAPASAHPKASPFVDFALTAQNNIARMGQQAFYELLRSFGAVPSGGMGAVLVRREVLDACGWLRGCFTKGWPRLLAIYRALLSGPAVDGRDEVGLLYHCYHGVASEKSIELRAFQQLVWRDVLAQDGASLTAEQKDEARDQMRKNGIVLLTEALESGADMQRPVWQAYQDWLQTL